MSVMFSKRQLSATNGQFMAQELTFTQAIRQVETLRDAVGSRFLSDSQILVIFNIFDMANPNGIKAPILGKLCNLEGPTLTRTLQTLSSDGRKSGPKALGLINVETDPNDKRQKLIYLTFEGERVKDACSRAMSSPRTENLLSTQAQVFEGTQQDATVNVTGVEAKGSTNSPIILNAEGVVAGEPEVGSTKLVTFPKPVAKHLANLLGTSPEYTEKELVFTSHKALLEFRHRLAMDESSGAAELFKDYSYRVETEEDRIERIVTFEADEWKIKGPVGGLVSHDDSGVVGVHKDYASSVRKITDIEVKPQNWVINQLIRGRRTALAKGEKSFKWRGHEISIISPAEAREMTTGNSQYHRIQVDGVWFIWMTDVLPTEELPNFMVRDMFKQEYDDALEYMARRVHALDDQGQPAFSFQSEMEDLRGLLNTNQYRRMRSALLYAVADTRKSLEQQIVLMRERLEVKKRQAHYYRTMANTPAISSEERLQFQQEAIEADGEAVLAAQSIEELKSELVAQEKTMTHVALFGLADDAKERVKKGEPDDPEN